MAITKRGNWYWADYTDPITKKRIQYSLKTKIKEKAQERHDRDKKEGWDRKHLGAAVTWNIKELIDWTWDQFWSRKPRMDRDSTYQIIKYFLDEFGLSQADQLKSEQLRSYRTKREKLVEGTSVNREFTMISRAFKVAICDGHLLKNPFIAEGIRIDESGNRRDRSATKEEKVLILENSTGMMSKIIRFALLTGMRQGQIRDMRPADIDFDNMVIRTKTWKGKGERVYVYFVPVWQETYELLMGMDLKASHVFHNGLGEPIPEYGLIHAAWPRLTARLHIDDLHFHDLRHTFATEFWRETRDIVRLMQILGHTKIETTMRYINISSADLVSGFQISRDNFPTFKKAFNRELVENH